MMMSVSLEVNFLVMMPVSLSSCTKDEDEEDEEEDGLNSCENGVVSKNCRERNNGQG
jgi:hypothetical protein